MPYRHNPNFTGREQILTDLHRNFGTENKSVIPQVVTGLGGIGKTQIANEYAYRYAQDYDMVWWIRAEELTMLTADCITLANRLQLPVKTSAEGQVFINIVRHWLETSPRRWLLILDNVETLEDITQLLPARGNGHILVTSRNPDWRSIALVLPHLQVFTPQEAREFLLRRTGQTDLSGAERLAELLGYLPLALEQAGAFITKMALSFDAYTNLFQTQRDYLWQRQTPPPDYKATITTCWEIAFQRVKETSPAGISLLNLCIFFAPEDILLSDFRHAEACLPAELVTGKDNPLVFNEAVAALYQYSLIAMQGDSLSLHRLVQEVAIDQLGPTRAPKWVEISVNVVKDLFCFDQYDMATWRVCARIFPHAMAVTAHANKFQVAMPQAASIWQNAGEYLRHNGEFARAREFIERALSIRSQIFGEDSGSFAESLDYLGELCQEQGNYGEASQYHQRALKIHLKIFGQEHSDTALNLNNLGMLFQTQGNYEKACEYYEKAFDIRKQVLGEQHPDVAVSLNNLGMLFETQGKYEQAREYHEKALAIQRQVLGEQHPNVAMSFNNLGALFQDQGKYEQAREYHEKALAIQRQVLGEQHPNVATSLNNLGMVFQRQGNYEQAREYHEKALVIQKQVLGEQHPDVAMSLNNLGILFQEQGNYEQSREYLEKALAIQKQVLGEQHPDVAMSLNNLGALFQRQGNYDQAREYHEKALAIRKQVLSEQHPDVATSLNNLGLLFQKQGNYEQAREYLEKALAIQKQVLGEQHPDVARSLNNLGTLLMYQGKYVESRHSLEQALMMCDNLLGNNHPLLVNVLSNLAQVMVKLRQFPLARKYVMRALSICKETLEEYDECQKLHQLIRTLPGPIGGKGKGKR